MTPADILRAAARRISQPGAWTQYCAARDARGEGIVARSAAAVRWCAVGALQAECDDIEVRHVAINAVCDLTAPMPIDYYNDAPGRTAEEVAAKLLEAAARLDGGQ